MMKRTLTAAALATVLAVPAFAQSMDSKTPAPSAGMPSMSSPAKDSFIQKQDAAEWRGSKVIGATVYGPDNASIGEVNDVLIGNDGKVHAAVIGVGGFLGVGEKNVAVPFESLNISRKADSSAIQKINVKYTKDQLKSAPTFAYYEPAAAATTGSGLNGAKPMTPATAPKN